jgi:hypothetical protein
MTEQPILSHVASDLATRWGQRLMPWFQCHTCGARGHFLITEHAEEWHRTHFPNHSRTDLLPLQCTSCSMQLEPGHRVRARKVPRDLEGIVEVGAEGVVTAIESRSSPRYWVSFKRPPISASFQRSQLSFVFPEGPLLRLTGWCVRIVRAYWRRAIGVFAAGFLIAGMGLASHDPRLTRIGCWILAPFALSFLLIIVVLEVGVLLLFARLVLDAIQRLFRQGRSSGEGRV